MNITIMERFDLNKYLVNPSRKVVTGDGRKVKILCTNRKGAYPIVALVENHDSDNESVCSYRENGLYSLFSLSEENNLFFAPKKHEGWVNLYKGIIYDTKTEAENSVSPEGCYLTTTKIEWEE